MVERYCKKCGFEICEEGDVVTMYPGKKLCECDKVTKPIDSPEGTEQRDEAREKLSQKAEAEDELVIKNAITKRDPNYLYYLDGNNDLRRKLKSKMKRNRNSKQRIFNDLNLTIPKILMKSFISRKEKSVIKYGKTGAMISMPKDLIGMKGRIIIIPTSELKALEENTVNLF